MPKIYKVRWEDHEGNFILFQTTADIVSFDASKATNLPETTEVQTAIVKVNNKVEQYKSEVDEQMKKRAITVTLTATITADGFDGTSAPYTQTIPLTGILETDNPIIDIVLDEDSAVALQELDSWCYVNEIQTHNDEIVVRCLETKPDADIHIQIKIIR